MRTNPLLSVSREPMRSATAAVTSTTEIRTPRSTIWIGDQRHSRIVSIRTAGQQVAAGDRATGGCRGPLAIRRIHQCAVGAAGRWLVIKTSLRTKVTFLTRWFLTRNAGARNPALDSQFDVPPNWVPTIEPANPLLRPHQSLALNRSSSPPAVDRPLSAIMRGFRYTQLFLSSD
jgi:hypothetical protein